LFGCAPWRYDSFRVRDLREKVTTAYVSAEYIGTPSNNPKGNRRRSSGVPSRELAGMTAA
jgi:hypothetical protein